MTSIFARDLSGNIEISPRDLIAHEISHLEGMGRSRWRTTPLMATCRTLGAVIFVSLIVLYFLDPFLLAINKTRTVSAYIYLTDFGSAEQVQVIRDSGLFSRVDLQRLEKTAQKADPGEAKGYFTSTGEAVRTANEAIAYFREINAMHQGDILQAGQLTTVRYYLFQHVGIITPREWLFLNPVLNND